MKNLDVLLHPGDLTTVTSVVLAISTHHQATEAAVQLPQLVAAVFGASI